MSLRTGKKYIIILKIIVTWRQSEDCNGKLNDFEIIGKANNDFCLCIKESFHYHCIPF